MSNAAPTASAARAIAGALIRHAITAGGSALVTHGYLDQETASSAAGPIADYALGLSMTVGAAGWSAFRARLTHARWVQAWLAPEAAAEWNRAAHCLIRCQKPRMPTPPAARRCRAAERDHHAPFNHGEYPCRSILPLSTCSASLPRS